MKELKRKAAILVGIVFLASGLLKMIDPVGTMLIVTEYAKFLHAGFLQPVAKTAGILLSLLEALTGAALITGVFRRVFAVLSFVLLGFFTLLTLFLWIRNPVMDCGCFGEAIHLTHAQSFLKNIVLLALSLFAFLPFNRMGTPKRRKYAAAGIAAAALLGVSIYSNTRLPILDFTDFRTGTELYAALDDDASDEAFEAARMLSFRNADGEYLDSLAARGKVVVFSVYRPADAPWDALARQYRAVASAGALPLLLAASYPAEIEALGLPEDLPVCYADYRSLIGLNRSNGGGTYFNDGELIYKWAAGHFPEDLEADLAEDPLLLSSRDLGRRRLAAQAFCVALGAVLLLL